MSKTNTPAVIKQELAAYKQQRNLPATNEQFIRENTVTACMKKYRHTKTAEVALKTQAPTLASLKRAYGDDFQSAYVEMWIENLNDFLNVNRKMSEAQVAETAMLLLQEYYYLHLADINLVFSKIKKGEFGNLFESIDGAKVLTYFRKYAEERMSIAENRSIDQGIAFKDDPYPRNSKSNDMKELKKQYDRDVMKREYEQMSNSKKNK